MVLVQKQPGGVAVNSMTHRFNLYLRCLIEPSLEGWRATCLDMPYHAQAFSEQEAFALLHASIVSEIQAGKEQFLASSATKQFAFIQLTLHEQKCLQAGATPTFVQKGPRARVLHVDTSR